MHDSDWQSLKSPAERLRWARLRWQNRAGAVNPTAKNAADSLGMKAGTYRAYERPSTSSKHTPMDDQSAIRFGKKYRVQWTWLLTGEGEPGEKSPSMGIQRTVKALEKLPTDGQEVIADMVEAYVKRVNSGA